MPRVSLTREEAKRNISNQEAVHKFIRRQRNPELYIGLTNDLADTPSLQAPNELLIRFKTVFDEDQRRNLRIILHPLMKRWTIFERTWHRGEPLWNPVCMFHGEPEEGYLPPDLNRADNMLHHLRGHIGDFRDVSYQDLEFVEKCDMRKYGWEKVYDFLAQFDDIEQKAEHAQMMDRLDDFLDYNFWLAMRDAQDHYSRPWSTRDVELRSDPSYWKTEEVVGENGTKIKVKTRVWGEEGDLNEASVLFDESKRSKDFDIHNSEADMATWKILAVKNDKYKTAHGKSLWEAVTGKKVVWSDFKSEVERREERLRQTDELLDIVKHLEVPESRPETVEDWLIQAVREKDKVPV